MLFQKSPKQLRNPMKLPKQLGNPIKALINIQNENNECFRWCLVRYLSPLNKNPAKFRNADRKFAKQLHFKDVKFPVHKKDYAKIEKIISPLM